MLTHPLTMGSAIYGHHLFFLDITELKKFGEEKYIAKLHNTGNDIGEIADDLESKLR